MGGSLFLLSPLFFGIFSSFKKIRSNQSLIISLWISILLTNVPILLLMGTGYWQIGPRYTLDFTVPLLLLTSLGIEKWNSINVFFLTMISTVHYAIGVSILGQIK